MESLKRTKIKALLASEPGAEVLAKGWVRTKRGNKQVKFIALNDGSTINNIQVVANTELFDEDGERLRRIGHEFGATTGRPRRTGWLDMVALKYAVMMNGVTDLIMMKSDVLDSFDTVKVAVAYEEEGKTVKDFPYDGGEHVKPVYQEFPGWKTPLSGLRRYEDFPEAFKQYIAFIEKETGCRIKIVSVGPDREDTVLR